MAPTNNKNKNTKAKKEASRRITRAFFRSAVPSYPPSPPPQQAPAVLSITDEEEGEEKGKEVEAHTVGVKIKEKAKSEPAAKTQAKDDKLVQRLQNWTIDIMRMTMDDFGGYVKKVPDGGVPYYAEHLNMQIKQAHSEDDLATCKKREKGKPMKLEKERKKLEEDKLTKLEEELKKFHLQARLFIRWLLQEDGLKNWVANPKKSSKYIAKCMKITSDWKDFGGYPDPIKTYDGKRLELPLAARRAGGRWVKGKDLCLRAVKKARGEN